MANDAKGDVKTQTHSVEISERSEMTVEGVTDICEFNEDTVKLKTTMGDMTVNGTGLSMSKLNTDTGRVEVNGSIDRIFYSKPKVGTSLLARLLK